MENKNYAANAGLNTINIAYSMRAPDAVASVRRRQETTLQYSHPRPCDASPKHSSPPALEPSDAAFNDSNLKYGKSQTLKEAVFNRLRVHIYRRDKRPKWLQLPNSDDRADHQQQSEPAHPIPAANQRENKTSLNSRKEIQQNPRRPPKLKTSSSEEAGAEASWRRPGELEMVDREKINGIVRNLLEKAKLEKSYSRYVGGADNEELRMARRRSRKLSNSINALSKGPFALKKLFSPPRLLRQANQTAAEEAADREGFEAWENSDLFGSHRNGIVEYTKEYVNPESREGEKSESTIFSSKKRRRFLIREKK